MRISFLLTVLLISAGCGGNDPSAAPQQGTPGSATVNPKVTKQNLEAIRSKMPQGITIQEVEAVLGPGETIDKATFIATTGATTNPTVPPEYRIWHGPDNSFIALGYDTTNGKVFNLNSRSVK